MRGIMVTFLMWMSLVKTSPEQPGSPTSPPSTSPCFTAVWLEAKGMLHISQGIYEKLEQLLLCFSTRTEEDILHYTTAENLNVEYEENL